MSVKSKLTDYLKKYPDLNMAVIRSLVDSAIEACCRWPCREKHNGEAVLVRVKK